MAMFNRMRYVTQAMIPMVTPRSTKGCLSNHFGNALCSAKSSSSFVSGSSPY